MVAPRCADDAVGLYLSLRGGVGRGGGVRREHGPVAVQRTPTAAAVDSATVLTSSMPRERRRSTGTGCSTRSSKKGWLNGSPASAPASVSRKPQAAGERAARCTSAPAARYAQAARAAGGPPRATHSGRPHTALWRCGRQAGTARTCPARRRSTPGRCASARCTGRERAGGVGTRGRSGGRGEARRGRTRTERA